MCCSAQAAEQQVKGGSRLLEHRSPLAAVGDLPAASEPGSCGSAASCLTLLDPATAVTCAASFPQGDLGRCAWGNGPDLSWIRSQPTAGSEVWR